MHISTISTYSASQLYILWHDGGSLGVDGAKVGIFEETNQVYLTGLLQSSNSRALETEIGLKVLGWYFWYLRKRLCLAGIGGVS